MLNKRKQMQHLVGQMRRKEGLIREYNPVADGL